MLLRWEWEYPTYRYWPPVGAARRGFELVYSPRAVGTPLSEVHALYRVPFNSSSSSLAKKLRQMFQRLTVTIIRITVL